MRLCLWVLAALSVACSSANLSEAPRPKSGGQPSRPTSGDDAAAPVPAEDSSSPPAALAFTHDVRIIVEPSDSGAALRAAIRGARQSVHMTMYLLSASSIISALVDQHRAGRDVRVVLNKTFPDGTAQNQDAYAELTAAGVPVAWAPSAYAYTHSKAIVIDAREAWIMTMNGTFTSPQNREYLAVDTDADDVAEAEAIFQADFDGKRADPVGKLVVAPHNARARLIDLIRSAQETIDLEFETFSDDKTVDALLQRHQAGVTVRLVVSSQAPSPQGREAIARLKQAGIEVRQVSKPDIHAKAIVTDGVHAYTGSINMTTNSMMNNRELGVLFDAPAEVDKVKQTIDKDFAAGSPQ